MAQGRRGLTSEQLLNEAKNYFGNSYGKILSILDENASVDLNELNDCTQELVRETYQGVTSSQLRNIFSEIKGVDNSHQLKLKRPRLAYVIARQEGKPKAQKLMLLLDDLIKNIENGNSKQVESFQHFLESIVAYHKYYEKVRI